ncbi:double-stranded RNA-binding protein 1-like protein [Tanacetum coccineum]
MFILNSLFTLLATVNETSDVASVASCYVFKSRLQEYAQKAGLTTPVYHTIKEGPSHQPVFRSTVFINEETYHSLTGFLNRKAAEQSAAEVALVEIAKSGSTDKSVSHPVLDGHLRLVYMEFELSSSRKHETGLCKNLLQEYAQKMNYAIPSYVCTKDEKKGRESSFTCTVDIGGIKYIGGTAKTKKEAELKAAKTALLAIKMSAPEENIKPDTPNTESIYTVVPTKRKTPERPVVEMEDKVKPYKRKKSRMHKRINKKKAQTRDVSEVKTNGSYLVEVKDFKEVQVTGDGFEAKMTDPSSGEVKDFKSNGDTEVKNSGDGASRNKGNNVSRNVKHILTKMYGHRASSEDDNQGVGVA